MQVTYCSGTESSLLSCSHTQLGSDPSCNALNGVGVRCIGMLTVKNNDINKLSEFRLQTLQMQGIVLLVMFD